MKNYVKCKIMHGTKLCKLHHYARGKLCKVQNNDPCKITNTKWKIIECAKSQYVQNYVKCKIMHGTKLCKLQNYAKCESVKFQ